MGNIQSRDEIKKSDEPDIQETEVSEGINFENKALSQIIPGFPDAIIELLDKQELKKISHLYYFPESDFLNMTGDTRDTCYQLEYIPFDAEEAFKEYMELFGAETGDDPERFDAEAGDYFLRFRIHTSISTIYINCYTNTGEEFREEKLDDVISEYSSENLVKNYLRKEFMVLSDSKSYIFDYEFDGDYKPVRDFYRELIPDSKEETRNNVIYIQDSVIGTEIAQYVAINTDHNTVNVDVLTYQK